jgi:putative ATP-binding cassette transporter
VELIKRDVLCIEHTLIQSQYFLLMELFYLLKKEVKQPVKLLIVFLVISGISNALLVGLINSAAENASNSESNDEILLLFACGVLVYILTKRYVLHKTFVIVESVMHRLRNRIVEKIRFAELDIVEGLGTAVVYTRLTQDVTNVSNFSIVVVSSLQSAIMMFFTVIYIGMLSFWSFILVLATFGLGAIYYLRHSKLFESMWLKVTSKETMFVEKMGHLLNGFKEIKINRSKNESVFNNYKVVTKSLKKLRIKTSLSYIILMIFTSALFYILIGGILFVLPHFDQTHSEDVVKVTTAILFVMGSFEGLIASVRGLDNANSAVRNIIGLEEKLKNELGKNGINIKNLDNKSSFALLPYFDNLLIPENLSYSYPVTKERTKTFTVKPVENIIFKKGELVFITGGNGSGKSTFLKLLTGLYLPQTGNILVDVDIEENQETPIESENYQQYRNLFSAIFTDFHLFDKLYGVDNVNPETVNKLLQRMELPEEKIAYENEAYTNLHLSTGQKKRVALTTAIMEDKPIYIFDEVAADLDPEFRDIYYYKLLRELKERNKTVIVVSHDRHYWNVPDRILEMDNGSIRILTKDEIDLLVDIESKAKWE